MSLAKGTSLAYIVGVVELSTVATQVNGRHIGYAAEVFATVVVLYFAICLLIDRSRSRREASPAWPHAAMPPSSPRQPARRDIARALRANRSRACALPLLQGGGAAFLPTASRVRQRRSGHAWRPPGPQVHHFW